MWVLKKLIKKFVNNVNYEVDFVVVCVKVCIVFFFVLIYCWGGFFCVIFFGYGVLLLYILKFFIIF